MWLKINGCDFNLEVAALSLKEFKEEFKHSYCKDRTEEQIKETHEQLVNHAKSLEQKDLLDNSVKDGINTGGKSKVAGNKGKGNRPGNTGA